MTSGCAREWRRAPELQEPSGAFLFLRPDAADLERLIALQQLDTTAEAARRTLAEEPERERGFEARLDSAARARGVRQKPARGQPERAPPVEKDVAVHQGRLSKFREQAMAVKTNVEYHAVQKEISFAQTEIKALEDKILERMLEADDITSSLKAAEADLAAEQTAIAAARKAMTAEHAQLEASLARIAGERTTLVSALDAGLLGIFEQVAEAAARHRGGGGAGRHLHHLSRPAAPAGLQHRAAQRADHPVRQLPAVPLFRAQGGPSRRRADLNPDSIVAYIDGGARGNPGPGRLWRSRGAARWNARRGVRRSDRRRDEQRRRVSRAARGARVGARA